MATASLLTTVITAATLTASPGISSNGSDSPAEKNRPTSVSSITAGHAARIPETADELRDRYHSVVRRSSRRQQPQAAEVVPELVGLYRILDKNELVSRAENARMQRGIDARLEELHKRLVLQRRRMQQEHVRAARRNAGIRTSVNAAELAGGGAIQGVEDLIDLIQTTISPESWEINGGRGSIDYFPH